MCRFIFYSGESLGLSSLITEPKNSLIHQSFHSHERREPLNGDGFGVAWYPTERGSTPGLFRSMTPAWNNVNLDSLAKAVRSRCILAHVRTATQSDSVSEANCHPFVRGRLAFMHNGQLGAFKKLRRHLLGTLCDESFARIRGQTDSELLFALFQDRLKCSGEGATADDLMDALIQTFGDALDIAQDHGCRGEDSHLNVAVSNGLCAVVTRFTTRADYEGESLYWIRGRYVCESGACGVKPISGEASAVVVSSERLDEDPSWSPVPRNHMVLIAADGTTDIRPVNL